ncbi:unnamed protein product, partial [Nesidiocoris tenuis]
MKIPDFVRPDFDWWLHHIETITNNLQQDSFMLEIFCDASLTGWGCFCNSESIN